MGILLRSLNYLMTLRAMLIGVGLLPTLVFVILLTGCSTRVEYFTDAAYPPRGQASQVDWLDEEATRPHVELARITLTSAKSERRDTATEPAGSGA